jgi:predicted DNA-binding transcriptional regulator YafY
MADTSSRMLRLLALLQSKRDWSGLALAEQLGVSDRTIRRDVDTLRELGYPVDVARGVGGHYRLGAGNQLPPLVFDNDQAVAVAVALQVAPRTIDGLSDAASRALDTVLQVMPSRLRHLVGRIEITSIWNAWDLAAPNVHQDVLLSVSAALRNNETLRYDYNGRSAEPGPARQIEPHHLVMWAGRWYLLGYDPAGSAWRTLRLDRVRPRTPNGPRFHPRVLPEQDNIAHFVMAQLDRGDTSDHWPCQGTATVTQPASLIAQWAPGGALVEPIDETTSKLWMGSWSWNGLAALLGTFDAPLTDVEPDELRQACAVLADRYGEVS